MTKPIKDKTLSELTLEDKALIVTARDIHWIKDDLLKDDYEMITSFITGRYVQYNIETNPQIIEEEFNELVPDIEETATVSTMLDSVYDYAESIIDILDKISTTDDPNPTQ